MDELSDEENETFINLVYKYPCLYDSKNHNYKDVRIKENIWKEISQELNKTSEKCKKQWKTIRDGYMRFKRKNKLPTRSEAPKSNRTKWKLYRLLSFLDNVSQERPSISSVEDESVSSQNKDEDSAESAQNNIYQETLCEANTQQENASMNIEFGHQKRIIKRPRRTKDDILSYMKERENARLSLMKSMAGPDDEFKSFANHIEHVLKNLPTKLFQIKAKLEIFEVLTKYEILAADYNTTSSYYTTRTESAMTNVSEDSQYIILNTVSPNSSFSEPTELTHQTENEGISSNTEFFNN